jgi:hypothetical protein
LRLWKEVSWINPLHISPQLLMLLSFVLHYLLVILLTQVLLVVTFSSIDMGQRGLEGNTAVCRKREGLFKVSSSRSYVGLLSSLIIVLIYIYIYIYTYNQIAVGEWIILHSE